MTPHIALVSREIDPFGDDDTGPHVLALARLLEGRADVTILTAADQEARHHELQGDPRLPAQARFAFVAEPGPDEIGGYFSWTHRWSAAVYEELRRLLSPGEPVLVEFPDYLGQAAVSVQGRIGGVAELRGARVAVRLYGSAEMRSVLDGFVGADRETRITFDLERYALDGADVGLWPGGGVLDAYRRMYGHDGLAAAVRLAPAFLAAGAGKHPPPPPADVLRLLYLGPLGRRHGVQELVRAVISLPRDDWRLTLAGQDTMTAPLGGSIREQLELMAAGDPRIEFREGVTAADVDALIAGHHAVLFPSLWACWPRTAVRALSLNRPLIATPTGGLAEMVEPDRSGWLARHPTAAAIAGLLQELLEDSQEVLATIASGAPRAAWSRLADPEPVIEGYLRLAAEEVPATASVRPRDPRLVSVVIPYFQLDRHLEEAVRSAVEQTYPRVEIVVVNDGSLRAQDEIVFELADRYGFRLVTQPNAGLGAARNTGIRLSRGHYVFPLDADNAAEPEFIERCVEVLDGDESLAFATSWTQHIDEEGRPIAGENGGWQPLGNRGSTIHELNVAGDAAAVIRRRVFERGFWYSADLTSFEDWQLYRELAAAGLYGHVIPERLLRYRIRSGSMLREIGVPLRERLRGEMDAHLAERSIEWESRSA